MNGARSPNTRRTFDIAYFAVSFVSMLVLLVAAVGAGFGGESVHADAPHQTGVADHAPGQAESFNSSELPCFACHSLARFRDGGDDHYPHKFHAEFLEAQHCHDCHRFEGHATPVIAELEECADCH